jgi:hypothetical protein
LDWAGSGYEQLASSYECGNEPLGSIKCRKFLNQLLQKDSVPWY